MSDDTEDATARARRRTEPAAPRRTPAAGDDGASAPRDRLVVVAMVGRSRRSWCCSWCGCRRSSSVVLSFGTWNGIGDLDTIEWVGFQNYQDIVTIYPPFWPAIRHNLIWLVFLFLVPDAAGHPARRAPRPGDAGQPLLPDRVLHARRAVRWPSSASSGSCSTPATRACINEVFGTEVDWYGDPNDQPLGRAGGHRLAAHRLRHAALPGRPEGRGRHPARGGRGRRGQRGADLLPRRSSR